MTADKDALLRAVHESARHVGIPAEKIDAFIGTLGVCGYRITAALAEKDDGGWMPIETAPKDQKIMTARPDGSINAPAFWYPDQYAKKPRPYWTSNAEYLWGKVASRANQPTHWRPLPPLPKGDI